MKRLIGRRGHGFTLAEIMVVLFVMTIILAAFAPMMTARSKASPQSSPWNWATPDTANTYFGLNANQRVMIGQKSKGDDIDNKLTINTNDASQVHILFKQTEANDISNVTNSQSTLTKSILSMSNHNVFLGGPFDKETFYKAQYNVALGSGALHSLTHTSNLTGYFNTAVGFDALGRNTTGRGNTAIGFQALNKSTGDFNTAIGYDACIGVTGSRTTCIGVGSGPGGYNNVDYIYLGNPNSNVYVYGTTELKTLIASSDARLKNIQGDYTSGLELIKKVKPVKFTFKDDDKKTPRVGVIAQDLKKIFPQAVSKGADGFLKIRQEDMFYAMINAIKELSAKLDTIIKRLDEIVKNQKDLDARLKKLEKGQ